MPTYVILLRGVTPTGKNRVLMAPLKEALAEAGLDDVATYIQSGNVIAATRLGRANLERRVHDVIQETQGAELTIIARTAAEFAKVVASTPFAGEPHERVYYTLLAQKPKTADVAAFRDEDYSPDQLVLQGDVVHTLFATKYSDSRFNNAYLERRLKVPATTRNWNTMTRLAKMVE